MDNLDTGMNVITIVLDRANARPEIDLGGVHPAAAIVMFQQAAECLEETLMEPRITYNGAVIYETYELEGIDDDDD